jgi:hypothetical protein
MTALWIFQVQMVVGVKSTFLPPKFLEQPDVKAAELSADLVGGSKIEEIKYISVKIVYVIWG